MSFFRLRRFVDERTAAEGVVKKHIQLETRN